MIIGIAGRAGAGKDTIADMFVRQGACVKMAFADPIKRICKEVYDFSEYQLWGPSEARNEPDTRYPMTCHGCQTCEFRCDHYLGHLTPRFALQQLGTEWGRRCYENTWVDLLIRNATEVLARGFQYDRVRGLLPTDEPQEIAHVVVPDLRFKNEADSILDAGGIIVKVYRPGEGLEGAAGQHASETSLNEIPNDAFSYVFMNTGTLKSLEGDVLAFYENALPDLIRRH